ncbi:MAG: N-acetylmuramoyl-L-alanine amidase [Lachnospiraceae bacterium]|nr:N-acetylmuramoyl-L-alanine amidase [Lachnospiraceae bacterium]
MKKTVIFILSLMLVLASVLAGCGSSDTDSTPEAQTSSGQQSSDKESGEQQESDTEEGKSGETEESTSASDEASGSGEDSSSSDEASSDASESGTDPSEQESTEPSETGEEEAKIVNALVYHYPKLFVVTAESLNVRETPSLTGDILGGIAKDGGGTILDEDTEGWLHIQSGALEGYVSKEHTLTGDEALARAVKAAKERIEVLAEVAKIRTEPSLEAPVAGASLRGAVYDILGKEGEFYKIPLGESQTAYIHESVVRKDYMLQEAVRGERQPGQTDPGETSSQPEDGESQSASEEPGSETPAESTPQESTAPQEETTQAPETTPVQPADATPGMPARVTQGSNGLSVCIDAGHQQGGLSGQEPNGPGSSVMKARLTIGTAGCVTGAAEYEINRQVSLQLEQELLNRGYTVIMIRTENHCPYSNSERAQAANNYGANAFVRIHCNSLTDPSVKGIINYAPTAANPYLSQDLIAASQNLASLLAAHMSAVTGAQNRGIINGDDMSGINWSKVPVTLVEMGFMSNPEEDRLLSDPGYQQKLVIGMANGIDAFFGR